MSKAERQEREVGWTWRGVIGSDSDEDVKGLREVGDEFEVGGGGRSASRNAVSSALGSEVAEEVAEVDGLSGSEVEGEGELEEPDKVGEGEEEGAGCGPASGQIGLFEVHSQLIVMVEETIRCKRLCSRVDECFVHGVILQ